MNRFLVKILAVIAFAGAVASAALWSLWRGESEKRQRFEANQRSLLSEAEFYKTSAGNSAASVEALTLKIDEFKSYFADYRKNIEQMGVKLRDVESISRNAVRADYPIEIPVRDTVVLREKIDTLQLISYENPYINLDGAVDGGMFHGNVTTYDTIDQVVYRVPRKFLFFRYGVKAIRQDIVTRNPYSQVTYSRYIKLKKKD